MGAEQSKGKEQGVIDIIENKLVLPQAPRYHVVGKASSLSEGRRMAALLALAGNLESFESLTELRTKNLGSRYEDLIQAKIEFDILHYKRHNPASKVLNITYSTGLLGISIHDLPVALDLNMRHKELCNKVIEENFATLACRLLEMHDATACHVVSYIGTVERQGEIDVAVDSGMNKWPLNPAYHTVRMRPLFADGDALRVPHANMALLEVTGTPWHILRLFELALKLAEDFARLDVPDLDQHELHLNYMNYFRASNGHLGMIAELLLSVEEEQDRDIRINCIERGSYTYRAKDGDKSFNYHGHSKYAIWACDFITFAGKAEPLIFPYFDNLHSAIVMSCVLWRTERTYILGEIIRSLWALLLTEDISTACQQEWYRALEDEHYIASLLHSPESVTWSVLATKFIELYQISDGISTPLRTGTYGLTHRAAWAASVQDVSEADDRPIYNLLRPGTGWVIDGALNDKLRTRDTNGMVGDLLVIDGKVKYVPRALSMSRLKRAFKRFNGVTAIGFGIRWEPAVASETSSSADVIHAVLSGALGVQATLWLVKKMFVGAVAVSPLSTSSVVAVCPEFKEEGAVVSSFLSKEACAEMQVVTDGKKVYTALADSPLCVALERNAHGRYCWRAATLPDIKTLRKGLLKSPALVGDEANSAFEERAMGAELSTLAEQLELSNEENTGASDEENISGGGDASNSEEGARREDSTFGNDNVRAADIGTEIGDEEPASLEGAAPGSEAVEEEHQGEEGSKEQSRSTSTPLAPVGQ